MSNGYVNIGSDLNLKDNKNISKSDLLYNTFFALPYTPPPLAEQSIVYTFPEHIQYYPVQGELYLSIRYQIIFILIYLIIWFVISYENKNIFATFIGFSIGLIIILIDTWLINTYSNISILTPSIKPYLSVTPQIIDPEYKEPINDPDKFINRKAKGDYKILLDNDMKTKDPIVYNKNNKENGYIYPATVYLDKVAKGNILPMNLIDYISGEDINCSNTADDNLYTDASNHNSCYTDLRMSRFNSGRQRNVYYNSEYINLLATTAYYLAVIIITWQIYKSRSNNDVNLKIIQWGMLSLIIILIATSSIINSYDIISLNNSTFIKRRMLILGISIGITSLFIE